VRSTIGRIHRSYSVRVISRKYMLPSAVNLTVVFDASESSCLAAIRICEVPVQFPGARESTPWRGFPREPSSVMHCRCHRHQVCVTVG